MLRRRLTWFALPAGAYALSFLWLHQMAFFFPLVIMSAPVGILALFDDSYGYARHAHNDGVLLILIHAIFWGLFFYAVWNAKNMEVPLKVLGWIFITLLAMLVLTMYGCATRVDYSIGC